VQDRCSEYIREMVIDSAGSSYVPEEQPVQRKLSDGGGDGDDDRTADNVVNMAWCDDRLTATAANLAATIVGVAFTWSVFYLTVMTDDIEFSLTAADVYISLSSIFLLYVTGTVAGWLINKIFGIPWQYGMLLAGFALQDAGMYTVTGWCSKLVSYIR